MRVYRFLAEPCSMANAEALRRQLWLAGDYRRTLARIENAERAAVTALYREDPPIADAEAQLADLYRRRAEFPDGAPERDALDLDARQVTSRLSELRRARASTDEHRSGLSAIRERRGPLVRAARAHASSAGLFWGTYLTVEDAHDRACRDRAPWEQVVVRGGWDTVAVQIQSTRPLTGADIVGGDDTRARISGHLYALGERIDHFATEATGEARNRSGQVRPRAWRRLSIRTGSVGRDPIWTHLHVLTEGGGRRGRNGGNGPRALPDAPIAWVRVHRETVGLRERWEVQVVVRDEEQRSAPTGAGVLGIDIGWRRVDGGIRVAYAAGPRGYSELVIPDTVIGRKGKSDDLRSIRDKQRDRWQRELCGWRDDVDAPDWYLAETQHTHDWRRMCRYVRLVHMMRDRLLWPDRVVELAAWIKQDRHLLAWEANNRRRMGLEIAGRQRAWISEQLRDHDVVGIESTIRIDRMRARSTAGSESGRRAAVSHTEVAPGAMRLLIAQMAASRGIRVVEVDPSGTTSTCPGCGVERTGDRRALVMRCYACGEEEDQDRTAAREIARRASAALLADVGEALAPVDIDGSAPKRKGRRNRKRVGSSPLANGDATIDTNTGPT